MSSRAVSTATLRRSRKSAAATLARLSKCARSFRSAIASSLSRNRSRTRAPSTGLFLVFSPWNNADVWSARQRLREEVDIHEHISQALAMAGQTAHPNIVAYIDSWEEEGTLYLRTEFCEGGNFAHFLREYGRHYPRLDEGRVWKVLAEISNVSVASSSISPGCIYVHGTDFVCRAWPSSTHAASSISTSSRRTS